METVGFQPTFYTFAILDTVTCCGFSLPKAVKRRLKALKKIQFEATKIEAEFYREVHKLECDYALRYAPLFEKVCWF